jgi:DNA-binding beta-propeller fold protein YncE
MRCIWAAMLVALAPACAARPVSVLPLGAPDKWRDVLVDAARNRVFVAHGNEVTVVRDAPLAVAGHITGLDGAHGMALAPDGTLFISSNKGRRVDIADTGLLRVVGSVAADDDTSAVVYDPASRHVFAMNDDSGTITVIDAVARRGLGSIDLGRGEGVGGAAADGSGYVYVAHAAAAELVRIDTRMGRIDARWKLAGCARPLGVAADASARRVFVGCVDGALLVLDAQDGRVVARVATAAGGGAVLFDARRHRIYVPNAAGMLSVIGRQGPDTYVAKGNVATAQGARLGAVDPGSGRLYLVTAAVAGREPPRRPGGQAEWRFVPGSVKLLVFDPPA